MKNHEYKRVNATDFDPNCVTCGGRGRDSIHDGLFSGTLCIGRTSDKRAVWQNPGRPPFILVHDAKQKQHLCKVNESEIERHATPYRRDSL